MAWEDSRDTFAAAGTAVSGLLAAVEDWTASALGEWDVSGLAGHLVRAADAVARYAAEPPPASGPEVDAAGYFRAYLERDPARAAPQVASRGREAVTGLSPSEIHKRYREGLKSSLAVMDDDDGSRFVATPYGAMTLAEYVPTRVLELTVHAADLAAATGQAWAPPPAAARMSLMLLADIASGYPERALALLGIMTGRAWADPGAAVPVLV